MSQVSLLGLEGIGLKKMERAILISVLYAGLIPQYYCAYMLVILCFNPGVSVHVEADGGSKWIK